MQNPKAFERHGVRQCYYIEMIPAGNGQVRIIPCFGQPVFEATGNLYDVDADGERYIRAKYKPADGWYETTRRHRGRDKKITYRQVNICYGDPGFWWCDDADDEIVCEGDRVEVIGRGNGEIITINVQAGVGDIGDAEIEVELPDEYIKTYPDQILLL